MPIIGTFKGRLPRAWLGTPGDNSAVVSRLNTVGGSAHRMGSAVKDLKPAVEVPKPPVEVPKPAVEVPEAQTSVCTSGAQAMNRLWKDALVQLEPYGKRGSDYQKLWDVSQSKTDSRQMTALGLVKCAIELYLQARTRKEPEDIKRFGKVCELWCEAAGDVGSRKSGEEARFSASYNTTSGDSAESRERFRKLEDAVRQPVTPQVDSALKAVLYDRFLRVGLPAALAERLGFHGLDSKTELYSATYGNGVRGVPEALKSVAGTHETLYELARTYLAWLDMESPPIPEKPASPSTAEGPASPNSTPASGAPGRDGGVHVNVTGGNAHAEVGNGGVTPEAFSFIKELARNNQALAEQNQGLLKDAIKAQSDTIQAQARQIKTLQELLLGVRDKPLQHSEPVKTGPEVNSASNNDTRPFSPEINVVSESTRHIGVAVELLSPSLKTTNKVRSIPERVGEGPSMPIDSPPITSGTFPLTTPLPQSEESVEQRPQVTKDRPVVTSPGGFNATSGNFPTERPQPVHFNRPEPRKAASITSPVTTPLPMTSATKWEVVQTPSVVTTSGSSGSGLANFPAKPPKPVHFNRPEPDKAASTTLPVTTPSPTTSAKKWPPVLTGNVVLTQGSSTTSGNYPTERPEPAHFNLPEKRNVEESVAIETSTSLGPEATSRKHPAKPQNPLTLTDLNNDS